jgi:hypothetical protein
MADDKPLEKSGEEGEPTRRSSVEVEEGQTFDALHANGEEGRRAHAAALIDRGLNSSLD